jgi:hypothetical protein
MAIIEIRGLSYTYPASGTSILNDIPKEAYSMVAIESGWAELVDSQPCPACGAQGRFGEHARYQKYHFAQRIDIQRVICHGCQTTHAMIPRFPNPFIGSVIKPSRITPTFAPWPQQQEQ